MFSATVIGVNEKHHCRLRKKRSFLLLFGETVSQTRAKSQKNTNLSAYVAQYCPMFVRATIGETRFPLLVHRKKWPKFGYRS